jgi:hypothetical protein
MRNVELFQRRTAKADEMSMSHLFLIIKRGLGFRVRKLPDHSDAIVVTGAIAYVDADERRRKRAHMLLLLLLLLLQVHPLLDQCTRTVTEVLHILFIVFDCRQKLSMYHKS